MEESKEERQKRLARERYHRFKLKNPEYGREASRKHRAKLKAQGKERSWPAKRENGQKISSYKESTPCSDCGNTFPACCMDFDHLPGFTKLYAVGTMVSHGHAWEAIKEEIDKCELVCSNCHRIRTRDRRMK